MLRTAFIIPFIYLSGCSDLTGTELKTKNLTSKNYTACSVLEDYLVEKRATREEPKTIVRHHDLKTFHYVAPTPIWSRKSGSLGAANPNTAREALVELKPNIDSRIDAIIKEKTYKAYNLVQEEIFEPTKCALPSYIYNKNDGLEIVNSRVKHNKDLRLKLQKEQRAYYEEKIDKKEYDAIRKQIKEDRKPYMLRKFSRIGINEKDDQAFFYTEHYCGMECAGGEYILMELIDGLWKVTARFEQWVS